MSINGTQKKRGRPATGESPRVPVRLDALQLGIIDAYCAQAGCNRSQVLREALRDWIRDREEMLKDLGISQI
jgi:metal-responsive CopG/Arc/MetJ family transcriptional regulator